MQIEETGSWWLAHESIPGLDLLTATITHSSPQSVGGFFIIYYLFSVSRSSPHVVRRWVAGRFPPREWKEREREAGRLIYAFLVVGERKEARILPSKEADLRSHGVLSQDGNHRPANRAVWNSKNEKWQKEKNSK